MKLPWSKKKEIPEELPVPQPPRALMVLHEPMGPVIGPQFCAPAASGLQYTVIIQWSSFAHNNTMEFFVTDAHSNQQLLLFKVDVPPTRRGPNFQIKRVLQDAMGTPIACAQEKLLSLRSRWDAHRGNQCEKENLLFKVQKSSYFSQQITSLDIFLADPTTKRQQPDLRVNGNYLNRTCTVTRGAQTIAEVRPSTIGYVNKSNFVVSVYPGIDTAFIALLVMIMEELQGEHETNL